MYKYNFFSHNIYSLSDGCSKDMFEYQNVCLALIQSPMSWTDARKKCQADKGDLVEIATSDNRKRFYILGEYVA